MLYIYNYIFIKKLIFHGYCSIKQKIIIIIINRVISDYSAFYYPIYLLFSLNLVWFLILETSFFLSVFTLLPFNLLLMYSKFLVDPCIQIFLYLSVFCSQIFLVILFLIYSFGYCSNITNLMRFTRMNSYK